MLLLVYKRTKYIHFYIYRIMTENSNSIKQYHAVGFELSKHLTKAYSTSFYSATQLFGKETRKAIHSIYGFVRIADEIVDTFQGFDKKSLLQKFEADYYTAYSQGVSSNPILHSFQLTVKKYDIPQEYIVEFLSSMRADLEKKVYLSKSEMNDYIYGSADVVGLMCLKVFCGKNQNLFQSLFVPAMRLGSAFQKVNFLRDLKEDVKVLGRNYFPDISIDNFDEKSKELLIKDIQNDFDEAYAGIKKLPEDSRLAVMVAYKYYLALLNKIKKTPANELMNKRVRVSDFKKMLLLSTAFVKHTLNIS